MNLLSLIKQHSPLLRVIVWAGVIVYGVERAHSMVETWADVTTSRPGVVAITDCATDTECEVVEAILARRVSR